MAIKTKIQNPRFPHHCTIYRMKDVNPFGNDGEMEVLYDGECRIYANTSIRIFNDNTDAGRVISGDEAMAIPLTIHDDVKIEYGDLIDATKGSRVMKGILVKDVSVGTLGSVVGFSKTKN